jgi:hypothetical protein
LLSPVGETSLVTYTILAGIDFQPRRIMSFRLEKGFVTRQMREKTT